VLTNARAVRGYLIDLDGTLMSGRHLLAGARELLARLEGRFCIVSNDSEHAPQQLVARFADLGIRLEASQVILAGTCALESIARRHPGGRVMVLGSAPLRTYARRLGLEVDAQHSDVVLVARDRRFSYAKLAAAAEAVTLGAALYIACPDTSHPGANGQPVPEAGALAAALLACTGPVDHVVIGKPQPAMFRLGCQRLGIDPADGVMIGDNPLTDGAGAAAIGLAFWQVVPGKLDATALFGAQLERA
jgi:HAD superfamily hydrolase (TIGR01450 family)